jgi:hypothetical protein
MRGRRKRPDDEARADRPDAGERGEVSNRRVHEALHGVTEQIDQILKEAEDSAAQVRERAGVEAAALIEARKHEAEAITEASQAAAADLIQITGDKADQVSSAVSDLRLKLLEFAEQLERAATLVSERASELRATNLQAVTQDEESVADRSQPEGAREKATEGAQEAPAATERPAYVRAAHMAMAGTPRDEIGDVLRREFGVSDPAPILDDVVGGD